MLPARSPLRRATRSLRVAAPLSARARLIPAYRAWARAAGATRGGTARSAATSVLGMRLNPRARANPNPSRAHLANDQHGQDGQRGRAPHRARFCVRKGESEKGKEGKKKDDSKKRAKDVVRYPNAQVITWCTTVDGHSLTAQADCTTIAYPKLAIMNPNQKHRHEMIVCVARRWGETRQTASLPRG